MSPLEILRQRLEELRSQITTRRARGTEILSMEGSALTPELHTEAGQIRSDLVGLRGQEEALEAQIREEEAEETRRGTLQAARAAAGTGESATRSQGGARVTREERTYSAEKSRTGQASFFADAYRAQFSGDSGAQQRIGRHLTEVARESETEARATTTTSFAGLVVPQYLVDDYALLLRSGRPVANVVNRLPLPDQGMSLLIPRGTTGGSAASQATENSALSSTDEVWANLTIPVVTVGGQQDVSRQSLERGTPGIDQIVFMDLTKAYNAQVDTQVINGSGASGQMLGILQTSSIGKQTVVYGAAVTPASFQLKTAGALSTIAGAGTAIEPNMWVMHPRRWYWLIGQVDSQNRPIAIPNANGVFNSVAVVSLPGAYSGDGGDDQAKVVGVYQGLPVILDANVPVNLGNGANEDPVIGMDRSEAYLWEANGGVPRELRFEQTLGQNLTIKLVLFNYLAFTAGRYPQAFYQVGGVEVTGATFGQLTPTF